MVTSRASWNVVSPCATNFVAGLLSGAQKSNNVSQRRVASYSFPGAIKWLHSRYRWRCHYEYLSIRDLIVKGWLFLYVYISGAWLQSCFFATRGLSLVPLIHHFRYFNVQKSTTRRTFLVGTQNSNWEHARLFLSFHTPFRRDVLIMTTSDRYALL